MARRGVPNEDLSNIEFETSEEVEVVPTFNSMVCITDQFMKYPPNELLIIPIVIIFFAFVGPT